ncbi:MAG TPA: hypothetical protein VF572_06880 [Candidatus Saccharimonadales bacterium]|jgi:hypothetical protein
MSQIRHELSAQAAGLEAASNAATSSLGLTPGEFAWFSGESRHPMEPQIILPDSDVVLDYFTSHATLYGGLIANDAGKYKYGHIQASVSEYIPEGALHQAGRNQSPVPYIPRLLSMNDGSMNDGVINVDTPTLNPSPNDGPVVIEGIGRSPRFRKITSYHTQTGDVMVRSGELITDGHGWVDDKTIEHDAFELPDGILLPRLATVVRTIKATSYMFSQIASRNIESVSWDIKEDAPRY